MEINKPLNEYQNLLDETLADFMSSKDSPYLEMRKISYVEKILNEREIKKLSERLFRKLEPFKNLKSEHLNEEDKEAITQAFKEYILKLDQKKLFFDKPFLGYFMNMGYLESSNAFIENAKAHDPDLVVTDLFQAIRNVWIMNSLQLFFGIKVTMTPSIFSYSMLYPYTDNYLDDPMISNLDKRNFNTRFQMVLEGKTPEDVTPKEDKIFAMIRNIEGQYDRITNPEVYKSLLLIQDAQVSSMNQDADLKLIPDVILPLSFYKGGSSVLADSFLIKGNLNRNEMDFSFGYGSFLQLLDDFQDTEEDRSNHHWTIFSIKEKNERHDSEVDKLLSFIHRIMNKHTFHTENEILIKDVITECTIIMVMEVIGRNPHFVSEKLYKTLESYSKVRLSFYKEFKESALMNMKDFHFNQTIKDLTIS
ncbi:MAG: hypothetical protein WBI17_08875 [Clostridiaceae bacterium]